MDAADVLGLPRRRAAQRGAQAGELAQVLVVPRVTEDLNGIYWPGRNDKVRNSFDTYSQ